MTADQEQHHRRSGGGMTLTDVFDTRPGGPNRQERVHRVGAPESPAEEIEEMGMLQAHTCVSVHCDQCGEPLGGPGALGPYPSEDAALDAAAAQSWWVYRGGRLRCSACCLAPACEVEGHEFTQWRRPLIDLLCAHREVQEQEQLTAGSLWQDHGYVFAQPNGRPIDPKADHQAWKDLLDEAGVREARLHDARHTAATMLLVLNVGTRAVMDMMGWSSSSMAARYQHVTNDLRHDIADSLGGLFWGATGTEKEN